MKYWKYILLLVLTLVFTTCKEEEPTMMIATLEMENVTFDISYREVSVQGRMVTNATVQEMVMEYSTDSAFREVKQAPMSKVNPKSDEPIYQVKLQELNENNLYYIRSRAVNKYSSVASASQTFKTLAFHLPEVQTDSIMDISVSSATLYATLLDRGTDQAPQVGFCFADHPEVTMENGVNLSYPQLENKDSVTFAIELTQLQDNVTYYVRAYAQNVKGVTYGQEISFTTTEIVPPTLSEVMIPSLSISYTTAMVSCEVLDEGGAPVIERGVCYSTMPNPTVESTKVSSGSGLGPFGCNLNDLIDGKTYYVRAYAINSKGTGYSPEATFTTVAYGMPMVMTGEVTDVTYTAAKVKGNVTSGGGLDITERGICYSTTHNPTEKDQKVVSGSGLGEYTCSLSDLTEATTYYARAYATNSKGTAYGEEVSFTTPDYTIPTVTTTAATSLSYESATCGGVVTSDGDLMITERGICYSTNPNPTIMSDKVTKSGSVGVFTCTLQGLSDGVSYYFRAYATNAKGTGYGELMTFATPAYGQPVVTTSDVTTITYTTAKAGGVVTGDGGKEVTERGVCYAVDKTPTIADTKLTNGKGIGSYTCSLTGLTAGTTYNVRAYATNSIGTTYGEMKTFTTPAYGAPVVSTSSITNITYTSANAGGEVTADGGKEVTERGICYSTSHNPTTADHKISNESGIGKFVCSITGLTDGTTYYVRAYATNSVGTSYGEEKSFTTVAYNLPSVTTSAITEISYTSATTGGNVTSSGGTDVTERGVCYSTSQNPTIADSKIAKGTGTGSFTCSLSDLVAGTTYYVRAYATNIKGTAYGTERSFTTTAQGLATVKTGSATNISYNTVTCDGEVTADGGASILECGICYSTWRDNPIVDEDHVVSSNKAIGTFSCDLSELSDGFTYHYCAYVINSKGVSYGDAKIFQTKAREVPAVQTVEVNNVLYTTAMCNGSIDNDYGYPITEKGICYATTSEPTIDYNVVKCGSGSESFQGKMEGLTPGKKYYVRAYAKNAYGVGYGAILSFTTLTGSAPTVTVQDKYSITYSYTTATIGGEVTSDGGIEVTERGICYSTSQTPTIENSKVVSGAGTGSFQSELTSLEPNTRYYYRAYAINSYGVGYSKQSYFNTLSYAVPTVTTTNYSNLSFTSVTVGGNVTADGGHEVTEYGICISRTNGYPTVEEDSVIVCGSGLGEFTRDLADLADGTTYYYRAYAKTSYGVGYGSRYYFTTSSYYAPSVSTKDYSDLSYTSVTVGGNVTSGGDLDVTEYGICISRSNYNPTIENDSVVVCGSGLGEFTHQLTNLQDGTHYYYRAYAKNAKGVGYGSYYSFTTSKFEVPSVSTTSYSDVTYTTAIVGGKVTDEKGHEVTEYGICISRTHTYPTIEEDSVIVCGSGLGEFTHQLTNLADGTGYYYRAYAKSSYGVGYGGYEHFTTSSYYTPSVSTKSYSDLSYTSVTVGGNVTSGGNLDVTEYGICISRDTYYPTIEKDSVVVCGSGLGEFTHKLTNLTDGTTYYYRAYAKNAKGVGYGDYYSFTTYKFEVPSVSTTYYSDVTYTTAIVGGKVTDEKGHEVTDRGICISRTNSYPTIDVDSVISCGSGLGEFSHKLTDLTDGTGYYYRAYAKSSYGVGYGDYYHFTTNTYPRPGVSTYSVSEITYFTAKFNGWSDNLSEHPTTEHGFCYATTSNPTVNDTKIVVSNMSNYFDIVVEGLEAGTTYYVRAYAINEYGVKYGGEQVFTTIAYSVPTLTTNDPTVVSFESALCSGKVTAYGGKEVTAYGICYSTSQNPTISDNTSSGLGTMTDFQCALNGLTSNVTYYYRAYATNEEGTGYGEQKSFTTVDYDAAVIYYTAESKLPEVTSYTGLHTDAFNVQIASHTFENGKGTIRFADKLTRIYSWAFERCTEMTSVTLPYSIEEINGNPFIGCTGLTSFDIPENVKYMTPRDAFSECYNIASFNVHPNNPYFCDVDGVLFTKDKKTLLRYPAGKTATSYSIPSGVNYIAEEAFRRCTVLTSVTIPQTVTEIKSMAFYECSGLTAITIPNSVTKIHGSAFAYCSSLTTVDIGFGVTEIHGGAFNECPNITSVTCRAYNPPSGNGDFNKIDKTVVPLYVPNGFVLTYRNASYWKDFTNILPIP